MNNTKTILLLGGTGFVGRAVAEKYLKNGWRIIIPTRSSIIDEAKEKLILHGFDKKNLKKLISNNFILFALDVDLTNKKWFQINNWLKLFNKLDIQILSISRVINFVGETSKSADKILKSNIDTLDNIFMLTRYLKSQNKKVFFCSIGSTAEKKQAKNLPPYERTKKNAKQKIKESNLCDYHFIVNYIKGKGEQKVKLIAPCLWNKLKFSRKWLFGFKVGVIDVDDLAEIIYHILEVVKKISLKQKPIEVNIISGELFFGEMIKNLLPEDKRVMPKLLIPTYFEKYFLQLYAFIIPLIKPKNQLSRRLANFAKKGSMSSAEQEKSRVFKTAEEIKKLSLDSSHCSVLEISPNLIIINKRHSIIYILREKSEEELKRIVQRAIFSN